MKVMKQFLSGSHETLENSHDNSWTVHHDISSLYHHVVRMIEWISAALAKDGKGPVKRDSYPIPLDIDIL
jgi:hypothetical protein